MKKKILINDYSIEAHVFQIVSTKPYKIYFSFIVTHDDYHDVTTLLYKNDFIITIPEENVTFNATITNYSTSITNLYEAGAEGKFKLELIERS